MHVRTDVYQSSATVSVDGKPVLHVPYLKGKAGAGEVGVVALAGGDYFANFTRRADPGLSRSGAGAADQTAPRVR